MPTGPVTSVFNDAFIAELYEKYRRDPGSVEESWRQFFRTAESLAGVAGAPPAADPGFLRKVAGAAGLVDAIRHYGHFMVPLDPLGAPPLGAMELTPEFHGITEDDLAFVPAAALGFDSGTAADVVAALRSLYGSRIALEFDHLEEEGEREWFRAAIERDGAVSPLTREEKVGLLRRLSQVEGLERFLGRAYVGHKRFSIEGTDMLVPMLDEMIETSARSGARSVVMGMAHRGRINVLAHILDKTYRTVLAEFEGLHPDAQADSGTGDVKYHLGAQATRRLSDGTSVDLTLMPNPSHLEFVNPVLEGFARALQRLPADDAGIRKHDERLILPVLVHGDAAFTGEGVVAETFNLSRLSGFRTGGTLHIIVNNQVGFTTDPLEARSTYYASDPAKGFEVPVLHVNADDAEACISAVRIAIAYRTQFGKDVLIDLVGYRRHGHNETDEPSFTQPVLYAKIRKHPAVRERWGRQLVEEGVLTADEVAGIEQEVAARLERIHSEVRSAGVPEEEDSEKTSAPPPPVIETGVDADTLRSLNESLLAWPEDFNVHPRLARTLERRRDALESAVDWGHAESLAFATLLTQGVSIRLTGQDTERGTFSHRQSVLHDVEDGRTWTPLQHVPGAEGTFEVYNSPLSETAVLAFEYGYSVAAEDALVLWEAQFGDFVNVASPIVDQFMAADRAKWGQDSGVVLLLPHGYEGQGPEHSSARLERFLQLSAEGNMVVAYPTTPAQYFHVLRRQARLEERRPLVLMQPKSMLRLPTAMSSLSDLAKGRFRPVLDDPVAAARRDDVRRIVFCTGKLYYDISAVERGAEVAVIRVEELYPWPHQEIGSLVDKYPAVEEVLWAQEEPRNMGAWTYAAPRLRASIGNAMLRGYIGRPERASPAEGHLATHAREQERIVKEVLAVPKPASTRKRGAAAGT